MEEEKVKANEVNRTQEEKRMRFSMQQENVFA